MMAQKRGMGEQKKKDNKYVCKLGLILNMRRVKNVICANNLYWDK